MSIIVTDTGFAEDIQLHSFVPLAANDCTALALDLPSDTVPSDVRERLSNVEAIRVDFPSFADGRGFTIASELRRMGFKGLLRAKGHLIADQYAMARRSGFDEVEIDEDLGARQPEDQWLRRADWEAHSYQNRLRGA